MKESDAGSSEPTHRCRRARAATFRGRRWLMDRRPRHRAPPTSPRIRGARRLPTGRPPPRDRSAVPGSGQGPPPAVPCAARRAALPSWPPPPPGHAGPRPSRPAPAAPWRDRAPPPSRSPARRAGAWPAGPAPPGGLGAPASSRRREAPDRSTRSAAPAARRSAGRTGTARPRRPRSRPRIRPQRGSPARPGRPRLAPAPPARGIPPRGPPRPRGSADRAGPRGGTAGALASPRSRRRCP